MGCSAVNTQRKEQYFSIQKKGRNVREMVNYIKEQTSDSDVEHSSFGESASVTFLGKVN